MPWLFVAVDVQHVTNPGERGLVCVASLELHVETVKSDGLDLRASDVRAASSTKQPGNSP